MVPFATQSLGEWSLTLSLTADKTESDAKKIIIIIYKHLSVNNFLLLWIFLFLKSN